MSSLYTVDIARILQKHKSTKGVFIGVFAHDQLPLKYIRQQNWLLVCNASPLESPGTHWFAIYKDSIENIELFDSLGGTPKTYNLEKFMMAQKVKKCVYNSVRIQSLFSSVCGHYAIYYGIHRTDGMSLEAISREFSETDFITNDNIVNSFYEKLTS